jgi:GMP synthase-like glutamine amidotransferase
MPQILVIQNDRLSPAGIVEERMRARGIEPVVRQPMEGEALPPSPNGYAAAIVLGGAMSANDDVRYPVMGPMRRLLADFHAAGKPILGICLGAQVLARVFGRNVRRHTFLEFGYTPLRITDAGRQDRLLAGLANPQWIMESHEDTFDLPAAAVPLMTGEGCVNQAFRVGRATYAFQCHFEATPDIIQSWVEVSRQHLQDHLGDRVPATLDRLRRAHAMRAGGQRGFAEAVADRWLELI